jgi:hypothetical protein
MEELAIYFANTDYNSEDILKNFVITNLQMFNDPEFIKKIEDSSLGSPYTSLALIDLTNSINNKINSNNSDENILESDKILLNRINKFKEIYMDKHMS